MHPISLFYTLRFYVEFVTSIIGRRFLSVVWLLCVCALVWFWGDRVGYGQFKPLTTAMARLVVIGVIVVIWLGYLIVAEYRKRRHDKAFADGIAADPQAIAAGQNRAEVEEIRNRLKQALALLRKTTGKRFSYIYELPWYMLIGAPGSGKTTALTNSGIKFPLGDILGEGAVQGVGGTRNCNWWFAEDAILVDTAGRYSIQDDVTTTSKAGWEGFLKLLKKYRGSQPVNGVIVTLSVNDILKGTPEERLEEIRAIRQRLAELDDKLGARIPTYIMLTKVDLLQGFVDFFASFGKSDRAQVWGTTFPLEESEAAANLPDRFLEEFGLLQERVSAMLLERLQQEPDNVTRGRIFSFPAQLAALKDAIHEIISELSSGNKLVSAPFIRGVYLVSGTQGDMVGEAGDQKQAMKRSFFLSRLFTEVIFGEAALVARDRRLTRRQKLTRRIFYGLAGTLLVVVLGTWILAYFENRNAINYANGQIDEFGRFSQGIPIRDVSDADFLRILPSLNALRPGGKGSRLAAPFWHVDLGLSQAQRVERQQTASYRTALNGLLLPRLLVHLQNQLRDRSDPAQTFDDLKAYGMLGGLGVIEPDFVIARSHEIFEALYPGEGRKEIREMLVRHVTAMVSGDELPAMNIDTELVRAAQGFIQNVTLADRAYSILYKSPQTKELMPWSPGALGGGVDRAFERSSKKALRDGVEGFFTRAGFQEVVLPNVHEAARLAIGEDWVRGGVVAQSTNAEAVRDTVQLYFEQFDRRWRDYLADMKLRTPSNVGDASEIAKLLAGEPNPLELVANSIVAATELAPTSLEAGLTEGNVAMHPLPPGVDTVPDMFRRLRAALAANKDGKSQLDSVRTSMEALYTQLSRASISRAAVAEVFNVDNQITQANQQMVNEARLLPPPIDNWLVGFATDVGDLAAKSIRFSVDREWQSNGAPACKALLAGRYPFVRDSETDISMDDFTRIFGPEGLFDKFFKEKLAPYVDTSSSPWKWRGTLGTEGAASSGIAQFERADSIRQAFFPLGATRPAVTIDITPVSLSSDANAVMLEIEGERLVYFHGPIRGKAITWPSGQNSNISRVAIQPGGWETALTTNGDWSPFRLFDAAEIISEQNNQYVTRFMVDRRVVEFDIRFGSALNPFRLPAIKEFECPSNL